MSALRFLVAARASVQNVRLAGSARLNAGAFSYETKVAERAKRSESLHRRSVRLNAAPKAFGVRAFIYETLNRSLP
ncbi:MAG: hypothetical protein FJ388_12010 [Verrucomicrobia bacterium]|nr:hypothetical protein [Verrucomicrobiota bacterium]